MIDLNLLQRNNILFDKRYKLDRKLGGGGFSEVWLAHDVKSEIDVALKIYVQGGDLDEDGIEMFRQEFTIVCKFNHSNILRPYSFETIEGHPYLILPYCERGSVSKLIGHISEEDIWIFINDVASGLSYLHSNLERPIIHQDIKPANVLIDSNGHYVITDFGISTKLHRTLSRKQKSSESDQSGTIAYMAPERFASNATPLIANDIWSLGATLYELVTGDVPFGEFGGLTQSRVHTPPKIETKVSDNLKTLILSCLSENTWERPTAKDLVQAANNKKLEKHKIKKRKKFLKQPIKAIFISLFIILGISSSYIFLKQSRSTEQDALAFNYIHKADSIVQLEWNSTNKGNYFEYVQYDNINNLNEAGNLYNNAESLEGCSDKTSSIIQHKKNETQNIIDSITLCIINQANYLIDSEWENTDYGENFEHIDIANIRNINKALLLYQKADSSKYCSNDIIKDLQQKKYSAFKKKKLIEEYLESKTNEYQAIGASHAADMFRTRLSELRK